MGPLSDTQLNVDRYQQNKTLPVNPHVCRPLFGKLLGNYRATSLCTKMPETWFEGKLQVTNPFVSLHWQSLQILLS